MKKTNDDPLVDLAKYYGETPAEGHSEADRLRQTEEDTGPPIDPTELVELMAKEDLAKEDLAKEDLAKEDLAKEDRGISENSDGDAEPEEEEPEEEELENEKPELPGADSKASHETESKKCPEGGELGTDFWQYSSCGSCQYRRTCQRRHNERAENYQKQKGITFLQTEAGLIYCRDLNPTEERLLSYVAYRSLHFGYCQESGEKLAEILKVSRFRLSQWVGNTHKDSLVLRGYLQVDQTILKRKAKGGIRGDYRTSRTISLTLKTVRLLNAFRTDGLYSLSEGKLTRRERTL